MTSSPSSASAPERPDLNLAPAVATRTRRDAAVPHVVIIGGGFAGLYCARALRKAPVRVTLVDRHNYHLFQPLLYQVATASLSAADIAAPIRNVLRRQRNTEVWLGDVVAIDTERRVVQLSDGALHYDYCLVASGVNHAYFGHPEWEPVAPGLKTIDDAIELRRRFLVAFEAAEREEDPAARRRLLTFVIVGGGPTGVELAGAMAEIARQVMPQDFRAIDTSTARILLLEGGPRVLPTYLPQLSERAQRQLEKLGVIVRTNALATAIDADQVKVGDEVIAAGNVFWAAGVAASSLSRTLGVPLDRAGRVLVQPDLSIPGHPEVLVMGDLASLVIAGKPVPGVAQAAIQMGRYAAATVKRDLEKRPRAPFVYKDPGEIATIGRAAAVAHIGPVKLSGFPAWLAWVFIHILMLIGYRNRILVMVQWAWAWFAYTRSNRIITGHPIVRLRRARGAEPVPDAAARR
jgi:NADH dehydrogenase